jgi:hypothetical protein
MNAVTTTWPPEPLPLTAANLLGAWGDIPGPDLSQPRSPYRRPGQLALRRTPTHDRHRAARGCYAPRPTTLRGGAAPHETAGLNTVWSANAPPAGLGA